MTNQQARQNYRGDAFIDGKHIGGVFKTEGGFQVCEQLGTHVGAALFNGRVFKKADLVVTKQYAVGCRVVRHIEVNAA